MTNIALFHRERAMLACAKPSSPDGIIFFLLICCMLLPISCSCSKCVTNDYMLWFPNPLLLLLWNEREKKLLTINCSELLWHTFPCLLLNHQCTLSTHCSCVLGNRNLGGLNCVCQVMGRGRRLTRIRIHSSKFLGCSVFQLCRTHGRLIVVSPLSSDFQVCVDIESPGGC